MTDTVNTNTTGGERWPAGWVARVGAFAEAMGLEIEEVTVALESIAGAPGDEALEVLASEEYSPVEDIKAAMSHFHIPIGRLRKELPRLRGTMATPREVATGGMSVDILPTVPEEESFTAALKVGGELKIGVTEVIAAVKASLANRVGMYTIPSRLQQLMEKWAERNDAPCPQSWYDIRRLIIRRDYAPVLAVFGLEGHFVNQRRKEQLFGKLEAGLWSALRTFQGQLKAWQKSWMQGAAGPGVMMALLSTSRDGAGSIPPGMLQPPDPAAVRDAAEAVANQINHVFAGVGIPVARALAYEAQQIKDILAEERLPAAVGAITREQMLKLMGVDVSADYVRMERSVVRYVMSILELPGVARGEQEVMYLTALLQLGMMIPWGQLA